MKLGTVLKKERERRKFSQEQTAAALQISVEAYQAMEAGESDAEEWAPKLAQLAITLQTPTVSLISPTNRAKDAKEHRCGELIAKHRQKRDFTVEAMAEHLQISTDDYKKIEAGETPLEQQGPLLMRFAELVELPIFNLFYPTSQPFQALRDY